MRGRFHLKRSIVYALLGAVCAVLFITLVYRLMRYLELHFEKQPEIGSTYTLGTTADTREVIYYDGQGYALKNHLETYLVMGIDQYAEDIQVLRGNNNHQQNDFNLLLVVDRDANTCTAIHLNRDTMTDVRYLGLNGAATESFTGQLALAHATGSGELDSCRNVAYSVSSLLYGITVDHCISLTMDGIGLLNDAVGGVTVTVEDDFSTVTDRLPLGEEVTLDRELAELYVRARGSLPDSTNLNRMKRQRIYMRALYDVLKQKVSTDEGFALETILELSDCLISDCTLNELAELVNQIDEMNFAGIVSPEGEAVKGETYMEFYVDEDALRELVIGLFYETVSD